MINLNETYYYYKMPYRIDEGVILSREDITNILKDEPEGEIEDKVKEGIPIHEFYILFRINETYYRVYPEGEAFRIGEREKVSNYLT